MVQHELCLPMLAPSHDYIVHNAELPLPPFVRDMTFDGIVLTQTFLSRRRDPAAFARTMDEYDFVRVSPAFKIAMPQDDYDCSAILDRWLTAWKVDLAYSSVDQWDVLYPSFREVGTIRQGFTGYVSEEMARLWRSPKAAPSRRIDVSYRAAKLPPNFGRLGYLKGVIGERFTAAARGRGLILDISTDPKDTLVGPAWLQFLEDSRFVLGVNSGSSVLDPEGRINLCVDDYRVRHPRATFEEVEAACFPGVDGRHVFTAISPRNIECALTMSAQLLTPGRYSGLLRAHDHYIRVEPDLSNADEVFSAMADEATVQRMRLACREAILSAPELRYEHLVQQLVSLIATRSATGAPAGERALFARYRDHIAAVERTYWAWKRGIGAVRGVLASLGARRVKRLLLSGTRS